VVRAKRPITLSDLQECVEACVREEAVLNDWLRRCVEAAFADPRPNVAAREVFQRLRDNHAKQMKAERDKKT
jgi:hypothetical protein